MNTIHTAHCKRKGVYSVYAYAMPEGHDLRIGYTVRSSESLQEATQEALYDITGRNAHEYTVVDHGKKSAIYCEHYRF